MASRMGRAAKLGTIVALLVALPSVGGIADANAARRSSTHVSVTLTDSKLGVSISSLQAGTATFVVVNRGRRSHALDLTGPGLRNARTPKLAPGQHATLTVKLRTGAYILSDPFNKALDASNSHWFVVNPATAVSSTGASGTSASGTGSGTSTFDPGGMNCD